MDDFTRIKYEYNRLHSELLGKFPILTKHHEKGVWAPSIAKEVYKIIERVGDKNKVFLDLGSGDGLVVMISSLFFKEAIGVEIDREFFSISKKMNEKLGFPNVRLVYDDFFNLNFTDYDVMYIAPDREFSLRFENKIEREFNGLLIVYSSIFQPKSLKLVNEMNTKHFEVKFYWNTPRKV